MINNHHIIEVNEANFAQDVLERSKQQPVVVDFWAPWCGPCRMLSPVLEKITAEANGAFVLVKINSDNNQRLAQQYGVQGIPAVKLFRDGKVIAEFVGAQPEPKVREFLNRYAPTKSDLAFTAAKALADEGRLPEAETALQNILAAQPDHSEAALALGKVLLRLGRGSEAAPILSAIPTEAKESDAAEKLAVLAKFMTEPNDGAAGLDTEYQTAANLLRQQLYEEAMNSLLSVLRKNRNYRNGEAKQVLLAIFEWLGDDPLVKHYRRQLANVLF